VLVDQFVGPAAILLSSAELLVDESQHARAPRSTAVAQLTSVTHVNMSTVARKNIAHKYRNNQ
jgi:hypothetical protein